MKKIGFAVVGSGAVAQFHLRSIAEIPDAELIGIYSAHTPSAEKCASDYGIRLFSDMEELLACEAVEVVNICTPSGTHAALAVQALEAGRHVVVEKPLALTSADCQRVVDAAQKNDKLCAVISQLRFAPEILQVKNAIDQGWLGKICVCDVTMKYHRDPSYYANSDWRGTWAMDGGGALMNQGIHGVDLLRFLMGEVKSVSGICKTIRHEIEVEDTAAAVLEYENGAIGLITGTTSVYPGYSRILDINGTEGSIRLEEGKIVRWDVPAHPMELGNDFKVASGASDPMAIDYVGHRRQIENMMAAIRKTDTLRIDAQEGKRTVELICAIYESSKTGKRILM